MGTDRAQHRAVGREQLARQHRLGLLSRDPQVVIERLAGGGIQMKMGSAQIHPVPNDAASHPVDH